MALYTYRAIRDTGGIEVGSIEAADKRELAAALQRQGLLLIRAKEVRRRRRVLAREISQREAVHFFASLGALLRGGIPVGSALRTIEEAASAGGYRAFVRRVRESVEAGHSLADSIGRSGGNRLRSLVGPIRTAEQTGRLPDTLTALSQQLEDDRKIKAQLRKASIYPTVIVLALCALVTISVRVMLPKVMGSIRELMAGRPLPPFTAKVMQISDWLRDASSHLPLVVLLLMAAIVAARLWPWVRGIVDRVKLVLPVSGRFITFRETINFLRVMQMGVGAGLGAARTLEMAVGALNNEVFRQRGRRAAAAVRSGGRISDAVRLVFRDPYVYAILLTGETSGELEESIGTVLNHYQDRASEQVERTFAVLGPAVVILLGMVVLLVLCGTLIPLWESMQHIGRLR